MISVIVTAYNIEDYIRKCIQSIINQTYQNLEIIIIDDGSTDQSGNICDELATKDARIKVIHKEHGDVSVARNCGIELAGGEYMTFVDGDDWIDDMMYESMMKSIEENQADVVVCRYRQVYRNYTKDQSTELIKIFTKEELLWEYITENETYSIQHAVWNKLFRKEVGKEIRFLEGTWYEDIMYTTKLLSNADKIVYIDQALYNYVIDRKGSIMNTGINHKVITDQIPAYIEKTKYLQIIGQEKLAYIHEYFVLKRLLLYYKSIYFSKSTMKKEECQYISKIIYQKAKNVDLIFTENFMNPNEKKKLNLFLKMPRLFPWLMALNEAIIIPLKARRNK